MSYGIQVFNPAGVVPGGTAAKLIIDENYSAYHYLGDATYIGTRQWRITNGFLDRYPIPFVVTIDGAYSTVEAVVQRADLAAGTWDIYVRSSLGDSKVSRVLLFSTLPAQIGAAPGETYGMRILRADSSVAFDSTRKPMFLRVVQDMSGFDTTASATSFSLTIPSLETPAVFSASTGVLRNIEYEGFQDVYREKLLVTRVSGTTLQHALTIVNATVVRTRTEELIQAPDVQEDIVLNSVVAVIDAAKYTGGGLTTSSIYPPNSGVFEYTDHGGVTVFHNYARFNPRAYDTVGRGFHLAVPGARVRFATTAPNATVYLYYTNLLTTSEFYNGWGVILVDGAYWGNFNRAMGAAGALNVAMTFGSTAYKVVEICFPYCATVDFSGAEVTSGYTITRPPSRTLTRWVAGGDSITHGFDASQQAATWTHKLAQAKNWQVINHGLGGRPCIPSDGDKLASLLPTVATYMIGYNDFNAQVPLATFRANFLAFINQFRAKNLTTKLYCITTLWSPNVKAIPLDSYRQQMREVVSGLGNSLNILVEGTSLMTNSSDRLTDTIHPNDTGSTEIASNLGSVISV
jgi:lysophospholipase L1-like esterase